MLKISVLIPVYDAAKWLQGCLDSLLRQSYENWEAVCVDDGSSDGSGEILDAYARKDGRFRVVHQKNAGQVVAREKSLSLATGDYVTFLDADDEYAPDRLKHAVAILDCEKPDLLRFELCCGSEKPDCFFCEDYCGNYRIVTGKEKIVRWGWQTLAWRGFLVNCFILKDVVAGHHFRAGLRVKVDSIFSLGLIPDLKKICVADERGYFYRTLPGSVSHGVRSSEDVIAYMNAIADLCEGQCAHIHGGAKRMVRRTVNALAESNVIEWLLKRQRKGSDNERGDNRRVRKVFLGKMGRSFSFWPNCQMRFWAGILVWKLFGIEWGVHMTSSLINTMRHMKALF